VIRDISWDLIMAASVAPLLAALAISWLFWRSGRFIIGNVAGMAVVLVACLIFGGAEYADALKFRYWCAETNTPCKPTGSGDFLRISVFAFIAMTQAMLINVISGMKEHRADRAGYDAQWR
jgi:hypothetical protein